MFTTLQARAPYEMRTDMKTVGHLLELTHRLLIASTSAQLLLAK